MKQPKKTSLLLIGHGSSKHPSSSIPLRLHADTLRRMDLFKSVHCAFLKEIPFIEQAVDSIDEDELIVLPVFLAEGYYTKKVIPEKIALAKSKKKITYMKPIGLNLGMQDLINNHAEAALGKWKPEETALLLMGHGSTKSKTSKDTLLEHISALKKQTDYALITDLWLEEPPFIQDWRNELNASEIKQVLFMPYLIADGQHGGWDIPELIGMEKREYTYHHQQLLNGIDIKLTTAIGKSQAMVDLLLKHF